MTIERQDTYRIVNANLQASVLTEYTGNTRVAMSCSMSATIKVCDEEYGIGDKNESLFPRTWKMSCRNTILNYDTEMWLYARVLRDGLSGEYIWSQNVYLPRGEKLISKDADGKPVYGAENTTYFYIMVGHITAKNAGRKITLAYGNYGVGEGDAESDQEYNSSLSAGYAARAGRLAKAVNLWGQSFDGSKDVSGLLQFVSGIEFGVPKTEEKDDDAEEPEEGGEDIEAQADTTPDEGEEEEQQPAPIVPRMYYDADLNLVRFTVPVVSDGFISAYGVNGTGGSGGGSGSGGAGGWTWGSNNNGYGKDKVVTKIELVDGVFNVTYGPAPASLDQAAVEGIVSGMGFVNSSELEGYAKVDEQGYVPKALEIPSHKLWGQPFNGTQDVKGNMSHVGVMSFDTVNENKPAADSAAGYFDGEAFHFTCPVVSDSFISAYGVNKAGGGGGGWNWDTENDNDHVGKVVTGIYLEEGTFKVTYGKAGTDVSYTQKLTRGVEIGTITIEGTPTTIYAPDTSMMMKSRSGDGTFLDLDNKNSSNWTVSNETSVYNSGAYAIYTSGNGTFSGFPNSGGIEKFNYSNLLQVRGGIDSVAQMLFPYNRTEMWIRTGNPYKTQGGNWQAWKKVSLEDENGYVEKAKTAQKLETARTIWGQSFNGTKDIKGNMSNVGVMNFDTVNENKPTAGSAAGYFDGNAFHFTCPVVSDGFISAYGLNGASGGGGISWSDGTHGEGAYYVSGFTYSDGTLTPQYTKLNAGTNVTVSTGEDTDHGTNPHWKTLTVNGESITAYTGDGIRALTGWDYIKDQIPKDNDKIYLLKVTWAASTALSTYVGYSNGYQIDYNGIIAIKTEVDNVLDGTTTVPKAALAYIATHATSADSATDATNADQATKLAAARKIWGQSFDGSGDVDGNLTVTNGDINVDSSNGLGGNFTFKKKDAGSTDVRLKLMCWEKQMMFRVEGYNTNGGDDATQNRSVVFEGGDTKRLNSFLVRTASFNIGENNSARTATSNFYGDVNIKNPPGGSVGNVTVDGNIILKTGNKHIQLGPTSEYPQIWYDSTYKCIRTKHPIVSESFITAHAAAGTSPGSFENGYSYSKFTTASSTPSLVLIADITSSTAARGMIGELVISKRSGTTNNTAPIRFTAWFEGHSYTASETSISSNHYKLESDDIEIVQPLIVSYNSKLYLALKIAATTQATEVYFHGVKVNVITPEVKAYSNATSLPTGVASKVQGDYYPAIQSLRSSVSALETKVGNIIATIQTLGKNPTSIYGSITNDGKLN